MNTRTALSVAVLAMGKMNNITNSKDYTPAIDHIEAMLSQCPHDGITRYGFCVQCRRDCTEAVK